MLERWGGGGGSGVCTGCGRSSPVLLSGLQLCQDSGQVPGVLWSRRPGPGLTVGISRLWGACPPGAGLSALVCVWVGGAGEWSLGSRLEHSGQKPGAKGWGPGVWECPGLPPWVRFQCPVPAVQVFGVQQLQPPGPLTLLLGSPNGALRSQHWGLGSLGSNGQGLRMQWLKCRGPVVQAQGSGTECQGKGIQESRFWSEGIWDPLLGALGSRHCIVRIQFVDIQNPVVELGDPGLEIRGIWDLPAVGGLGSSAA